MMISTVVKEVSESLSQLKVEKLEKTQQWLETQKQKNVEVDSLMDVVKQRQQEVQEAKAREVARVVCCL